MLLTYCCYAAYHMNRKPISVVKVLDTICCVCVRACVRVCTWESVCDYVCMWMGVVYVHMCAYAYEISSDLHNIV